MKTTWNNCVGTYTRANGHKYVGQFKDDYFNGAGIFIWKKNQARFEAKFETLPKGWRFNSNVHKVFPNLKNQFTNFSTYKRKKIQSNLKRKGLYTSSIDGQWGRGTLIALVEFSSKNLGTVDLRSASMSKKLLDAVLR